MPKHAVNIVEATTDEDQAFDQPCKHENRVGGHGTYCHHPDPDFRPRKCPYRFCDEAWHSKCAGFEPNPNFDRKRFDWLAKEAP